MNKVSPPTTPTSDAPASANLYSNHKAAKEYHSLVERLKEHLVVLIHFTSGLPARGTEVASIKLTNNIHNQRNIYIWRELILIVTEYNKSENVLDRPKVIAQFLPLRLSRILLTYIINILPFSTFVAGNTSNEICWPSSTSHLFSSAGVQWTSSCVSDIISDQTLEILGF